MSEIDDSIEKLTALCMGLEIPPSTAASMGAMGLKAIGTAIAEQAKKAGREDVELTRLLAIEAAAKKLGEALEWVMKDYEGMCRKGYQQSANWKKRVVMAKASSKAFQRSINPIGDKNGRYEK